MFGLEYIVVLIKILFNISFAFVTAIPLHIAWNNTAPKFISFLPEVYMNISFKEMFGILLVITFVGEAIQKLTPKIVSINQSNSNNKE